MTERKIKRAMERDENRSLVVGEVTSLFQKFKRVREKEWGVGGHRLYVVAKTHGMSCLYRSFSAKEPRN